VRWFRGAVHIAVTASLAGMAVAAQGRALQFGVGTGLAVPVGDYHAAASGEGFNTSWQGLAFVALRARTRPIALRVDLGYGANSANAVLKNDLTATFGRPSDEKVTLLGGNLDLVYQAASPARVRPYLLAGIGAYHQTISVTTGNSTADTPDTKFAWNVGGGLSYSLRGVGLFLEGRYINVVAVAGFPRTTVFPITLGVRFVSR